MFYHVIYVSHVHVEINFLRVKTNFDEFLFLGRGTVESGNDVHSYYAMGPEDASW